GMLLILRVYDAVGLLSVGALGLAMVPELGAWRWLSFALVIGLLAIAVRLDFFLHLTARLLGALRTAPGFATLTRFAERLAESSSYSRNPRFVATAFGLSLAVWLSLAGFFAAVLYLFGYRVSAGELLVASAVTNMSGFIPASALGSFGPIEAGWTAALSWAGLQPADAAASGLATHLAMVLLLALLSLVFVLQLWPRIAAARRTA
ncbi:MAG: lysylphosphatidylglycerol synthase domain-containing protein, partial [Myxococcota bacterium]